MDASNPVVAPARAVHRQGLLHRWPSALGLLAAMCFLATGVDGQSVAIVVCVATLCYLGAAALNLRWIAWAGIVGGGVVVAAGEMAGLPWWAALALVAAALVVIGLFGGVPRRALAAQAAAVLGFGSLAVVALFLAPRVSVLVVGIVLVSHAGWDLVHYRRNEVVPRSLAEFCMLLDVPLGLGAVVMALTW